jgi:hypothetical protein
MTYVVQKNSPEGERQWLCRAQPTLIWGDKRHAIVFVPDAVRWKAA